MPASLALSRMKLPGHLQPHDLRW